MGFFLVLVQFLLVLTILIYTWYCVDGILNHGKNRIIYVSSPVRRITPLLLDVISRYIPDTTVVSYVEPGAGLAHMARLLSRKLHWKEVITVDISLYYCFFSRIFNVLKKAPIQSVHTNALTFTYPAGALIYCYLSTDIMCELYTQGKLKDTLVITLTFGIPDVTPDEEIPVKGMQRRLLVYDFRQK